MSHAVDQLKAQGKEPQTCQDYLDVFSHQGRTPLNHLSKPQRARKMRFDQFMSVCGGFSLERDYPGKSEPDAPPKCEGCRKQGEKTGLRGKAAGGGAAGGRGSRGQSSRGRGRMQQGEGQQGERENDPDAPSKCEGCRKKGEKTCRAAWA